MFAITGITGQVGGAVAQALLDAGQPVRAVVRDAAKAADWARRGCEVAVASLTDAEALTRAFEGTRGVFFLLPPVYDPAPDFAETRSVIAAVRAALETARPGRVVSLSTIGAQSTRANLLSQHGLQEAALGTLPMPVTFLRAAWFMENAAWDVAAARETGVMPSFLAPLDRTVPMIATADIGRVAAELLQDAASPRVVELVGEHLSPNDIAAGLARALGREVRAEVVPRATWEALFRTQGMRDPLPRMRMLDGFNEGWIGFEQPPHAWRHGTVRLDEVLRRLVAIP